MGLVYNVLEAGFSFILSLFYNRIDVKGQEGIPTSGPVIFCGNHGNGLIDPLVIMCVGGRQVSAIAKSTLFTIPILGSLLHALKAVPVKRRQDFKGSSQDNSPALDAMSHILAKGDCLAIFPEGVSHDSPEVHELKTGFARAAVQALLERDSEDFTVTIIPVGLNFTDKDRFRSNVFVEFGKPTTVTKHDIFGDAPSEKYDEVSRKFVVDLTHSLRKQLENVTLVAPNWEVLRVLYLARDLYAEPGVEMDSATYIELTHRFVNGYQRAKNEKAIGDLFAELSLYQSQLDLLRITDRLVAELNLSKLQIGYHFVKGVIFYLVTLPISLPGSIIHGPLGLLCKYLGRYLSRAEKGIDRDQVAHFKIMAAIVLTPVWYSLMGLGVWKLFGPLYVAPFLASSFLSGYLAIQLRPLAFTFKALGFVMKFLFTDFKALRTTRKRLQIRVRDVINKYRDQYLLLILF